MKEIWQWEYYNEIHKRRIVTRHHMTEEEARKQYGPDAVKVEWSRMEIGDRGDQSMSRFCQGPKPTSD